MIRRLIILLLIVGCTTNAKVTFTSYSNNEVFEGEGGSMSVVDGVDFWNNGHPNRKYKIIGIIDYDGTGIAISNSKKDGKIVTTCKEFNCDGVILITEQKETKTTTRSLIVAEKDTMIETQQVSHRNILKYEVIKYLD